MPIPSLVSGELKALEDKALKRSMRIVDSAEGASLTIDGRSYVNFGSNNYLGLTRHPRVLEAVHQAVQTWGTGAGASRLLSGTTRLHDAFEQTLAAFFKKEAALVFPAGYMANLAVVTALVGPGDAVIADRLCHASLIDAVRLSGARLFVYKHVDVEDAERALKRAQSHRRRLLITESLFSMDGDFAPLDQIVPLAHVYDAIMLVDEAHAIGVWGPGGRGLSPAGVDIVVGTLSKSLASQGGFICASRPLIDLLVNKSREFIFTTGLSPMCVAAAQGALAVLQEEEALGRRVQDLSGRLREGVRHLGFQTLGSKSQIVPILLGSDESALRAAAHLWGQGFYAPAIRPPTVHAGECRLRFSVMAGHTEGMIDQLLNSLTSLKETSA
jgi:8-amino-7-oxononanoate synthase